MTYRKKLIEVALPLKAINEASAREKSIRHGHPSTLHLWWARRPLAACRAVLFASLVDDPDSDPMYAGAGEEITGAKRAELFNLIEELVRWENSNNPRVINRARAEIARSIAANNVADGEWTNDTLLSLTGSPPPIPTRSVSEARPRSVSEESTPTRSVSEDRPRSVSEESAPTRSVSEARPRSVSEESTPTRSVSEDRPRRVSDASSSSPAPSATGLANASGWCGDATVPKATVSVRDLKNMLAPPEAVNAFLAEHAPPVLDPFCGGGSIPLEAQRLGLRAYASDLNPVAVLITKALIEIPPKFAGLPPVNPEWQHQPEASAREAHQPEASARSQAGAPATRRHQPEASARMRTTAASRDADSAAHDTSSLTRRADDSSLTLRVGVKQRPLEAAKVWQGAQGLAEDVRYYGRWMRDEAQKRIGHLYPKVKITPELAQDRPDLEPYLGQELTVIAWLWARTVKCPNPACGGAMPLVSSFMLSSRRSNRAFLRPIVSEGTQRVKFDVEVGDGSAPPGVINRRGVTCVFCRTAVPFEHVRASGVSEQMGQQLMAIVAEGQGGRVFLPPNPEHENIALQCERPEFAETSLPEGGLGFRVQRYGITKHRQLFTARQLSALCAFADLTKNVRSQVLSDARAADGAQADRASKPTSLAETYADAVTTYLALALSKAADLLSSLCHWQPNPEHLKIAPTFTRPTLSMTWDFAEGNPFSTSSGNFGRQPELIEKVIASLADGLEGRVDQRDAQAERFEKQPLLISTDPPYYDNIGYADLSDFFYVWLRRMLQPVYPMLFSTLLVPKGPELISDASRHGSQENARLFFERGLEKTFNWARVVARNDFPFSVYYAFKQSEEDWNDESGAQSNVSTGWEAMLEGLVHSSINITGTWPVRTERPGRPRDNASNALASSIVLICRARASNAPLARRKDFMNALRAELPEALKNLQHGNIAPVDLAQAAIGPGMAVFTRYAKVVEADGSAMSVRTALGIINQVLDEVLAEQEGDFDPDTRWAVGWFAEYGMNDGPFGVAETLSKAKNTAVAGLVEAGVVKARAGKVRLVGRDELPDDWDPGRDGRLTVWETTQHLIRALATQGETGAAALLARLGGIGESARELAYRLYTLCERKKWADEALAYNGLVIAWPELTKLAHARRQGSRETQEEMF